MKISNKLIISISFVIIIFFVSLSFLPGSSGEAAYYQGNKSNKIFLDFYVKNYRTYCHGSNIYWFDSMDNIQDIYQKCSDDNPCTIDTCIDNKCRNLLRCDGSSCLSDSADYAKYCGFHLDGKNTTPPSPLTEAKKGVLEIFMFGKKESDKEDFREIVEGANKNEKISFLAEIQNNSDYSVKDVSLKINFAGSISYDGGLSIDGVDSAGDLISGLNIGTIPSKIKKKIIFYGIIDSELSEKKLNVSAIVSSDGNQDSDDLSILIGDVSNKDGFITIISFLSVIDFIKKRYIWIIIGIGLIVLFFLIFRKLSPEI